MEEKVGQPVSPRPSNLVHPHMSICKLGGLVLKRISSLQWTVPQTTPQIQEPQCDMKVKSNGSPAMCFSPEIGSGSFAGLLELDCWSGELSTLNKCRFPQQTLSSLTSDSGLSNEQYEQNHCELLQMRIYFSSETKLYSEKFLLRNSFELSFKMKQELKCKLCFLSFVCFQEINQGIC